MHVADSPLKPLLGGPPLARARPVAIVWMFVVIVVCLLLLTIYSLQLIGSGIILREVEAAADLLREEWDVTSDVWSAPSFTELARDGREVERWNLLHPDQAPRKSYVAQCFAGAKGPIIASTDWIRAYAEQIRPYLSADYHVLGTDGFGRSDNRPALRDFFEVDRRWIVVSALKALAANKLVPQEKVAQAIKIYGIKADRRAPWLS